MRTVRYKFETTLNQEEETEIQKFCKKYDISRYTLIRRAVFEMINRLENKNLKDFT